MTIACNRIRFRERNVRCLRYWLSVRAARRFKMKVKNAWWHGERVMRRYGRNGWRARRNHFHSKPLPMKKSMRAPGLIGLERKAPSTNCRRRMIPCRVRDFGFCLGSGFRSGSIPCVAARHLPLWRACSGTIDFVGAPTCPFRLRWRISASSGKQGCPAKRASFHLHPHGAIPWSGGGRH